jgi:membrane-associated phospholipid phosphatase
MRRFASKIKEPLLQFTLKEILSPIDLYSITMLGLYSLMALVYLPYISNSSSWIMFNVLIASSIISLSAAAIKLEHNRLFLILRRLSVFPLILFVYDQAQIYIRVINPHDYDNILISWDRAIFGVNPTQWISMFASRPLTEFLQLSYMLYFIMPVVHAVELHLKKKDIEYDNLARKIAFSFYISYLLYFIMPAIGPRFTLHNFTALNTDLPGLWLTNTFREIINVGANIVHGAINPAALVNRDCMPSGHTWLTLINIIMSFRNKSRFRYAFLFFGTALIISTVYLRYHYVVDVMAGAVCACLALIIEPRLVSLLRRKGFNRLA